MASPPTMVAVTKLLMRVLVFFITSISVAIQKASYRVEIIILAAERLPHVCAVKGTKPLISRGESDAVISGRLSRRLRKAEGRVEGGNVQRLIPRARPDTPCPHVTASLNHLDFVELLLRRIRVVKRCRGTLARNDVADGLEWLRQIGGGQHLVIKSRCAAPQD